MTLEAAATDFWNFSVGTNLYIRTLTHTYMLIFEIGVTYWRFTASVRCSSEMQSTFTANRSQRVICGSRVKNSWMYLVTEKWHLQCISSKGLGLIVVTSNDCGTKKWAKSFVSCLAHRKSLHLNDLLVLYVTAIICLECWKNKKDGKIGY